MNKLQTEILTLCKDELATASIIDNLRLSNRAFKKLSNEVITGQLKKLHSQHCLAFDVRIEPSLMGGIKQVQYWKTTAAGLKLLEPKKKV